MKKILSILTATAAIATNLDMQARSLVVYFSHSGNTRIVAEKIQELTQADIFEIVPENEYPADYQTVVDQARNEIKTGARPALQESDLDLTPYDTLFVGSPCWWSTIAPPVATFLTTHDFAGKTIVPFMTHEGSRMGHSESDIRDLCPKATLLPGLPIRGSEAGKADAAIKKWLQTHDLLKK